MVSFLRFRFQRLEVATILHCSNHFLPTRGCNSHMRRGVNILTESMYSIVKNWIPHKGLGVPLFCSVVPFPRKVCIRDEVQEICQLITDRVLLDAELECNLCLIYCCKSLHCVIGKSGVKSHIVTVMQ